MREEIRLKTSKSGTTINFFDTMLTPNGVDIYPAYVLMNNMNEPIYIGTFEHVPMWRDGDNNYVPLSSLGLPFITGGTRHEELPYSLVDTQKQKLATKWADSMTLMSSGASISHTFFKDIILDDMFIDLGIYRSYGTLDTLSLYNNMINGFPVQESETGTVFGRLTAIQKLLDNDGNNISIPLKNVPVGIFNPTEEFPSPASMDQNGDRITLNLKESSPASSYFNIQSYTADTTNYLKSGSEFTAVPQYYKYVTTTNEEGEFVIHNVPIGTQTLFFEVDLFKQGLTQDEIALNFFPFPADETSSVSKLPNLFFRQFPIDVVPTWGSVQTGYTEVNIAVDLDLRKWATYFVEQVSFNGLDFNELQRRGFVTPLTIDIRNMAKEGYPQSKLQIVEIPNMVNRDQDHVLLWENEFPQLKNRVTFYTQGYHAFKLPANMYDPVGTKTDQNGFPTESKGVWLAGYQMSLYFNDKKSIFRNTGLSKFKLSEGVVTRDHFNLNKNNIDMTVSNGEAAPLLGNFPYERKWDHNYPEPYSIPHIPNQPNPDYDVLNPLGKRWLERPRFLDGDIAGTPFDQFDTTSNPYGGTGGYGAAKDDTNGEWFKTDFSKYVTANYVYNYENTENPNSMYSNAYKPNDSTFPLQPLASKVLNGERYQRVECGYGYWLKPEGWPRIVRYGGFDGMDVIYPSDTERPNVNIQPSNINSITNEAHSVTPYDTSFEFISTASGKKLFIHMGTEANIKEGSLDLFRIIDPSPQNINAIIPTVVETFTNYCFNLFFFQRGRDWTTRLFMDTDNSGGSNGNEFWSNGGAGWELSINEMRLNIRNSGSVTIDFMGRRLAPGASADFFGGEISDTSATFENAIMKLPGNFDFDYDKFRYRKTKYDFIFRNVKLYNGEGNFFAGAAVQEGPTHERPLMQMTLDAGPSNSIPRGYLRSYLTNVDTYCDGKTTAIVDGMAFPNPDQGGGRGDPFWGARFWPRSLEVSCLYGVPYRDDSQNDD